MNTLTRAEGDPNEKISVTVQLPLSQVLALDEIAKWNAAVDPDVDPKVAKRTSVIQQMVTEGLAAIHGKQADFVDEGVESNLEFMKYRHARRNELKE
jgi:hypothetical protein